MIATLRCHSCPRTEEIKLDSARAAFHFDQVAAEHGWRVHTILHTTGRVEAIDVCPDCIAVPVAEGRA